MLLCNTNQHHKHMQSADRPPEPPVPEPNAGVDARSEQTDQRFPVVAVGASAGGLEAFRELLRRLRPDTGMAFVFVQHLAPKHESMLVQLLARETPMPVNQAVDGTMLSPNQVYVIPPNAILTVSGLALAIKPREGAGTTIDPLLRSLAASHGSHAIAVILSGTGSDGTLGVQSIAEEGGIVFAQEPESAKFDGMPRNAIATGCVDFVLAPGGIAAELARIAREPHFRHGQSPEPAPSADTERDIQDILDLLRDCTGIDFGLYRQTTVRRRMERRVALLRQHGLADYLQYVRNNPDELQALAQDILIRVTSFFRDPEVFEVLSRRVFPALIRRTPLDSAVRVWVPGCSTGEEAYSIAICYQEAAEQMQSRIPVQVFGTDINEAAIEKARRGTYVENIAADVTPERLARFFVRVGKEFQVARRLRDGCIFSRHDLLNDPPFSRMSLISCRNVLIYLESLQKRALSKFHFALNPGGFLLLGKSESAAASPELFAPLDKEAKLYVRQEAARHPLPAYATPKRAVPLPRSLHEAPAVGLGPARGADLRQQADRVVLDRYGPPRVIVTADLETLTYSGKTPAFLGPVFDTQNQRVFESLEKTQADALKNAIGTAGETGHAVRVEQLKVGEGAGVREVTVEITPIGPEMQYFVIVFEEPGSEPAADSGGATSPTVEKEGKFDGRRAERLEKELASTRIRLESIIIEQEAAHEEVVASNEELQSLNEELESSKEELQASNEELTTVNQELQVRNSELDSAREFAQATLDTVRGSLVVLGPDLRVLKANTSFYRTFRLTPAEVEHYLIYELGDGHWSLPRLRVLLEDVLPKNQRMEDFEMEYESPATGPRVLVLNARRFEREERILLAMEDATEIRRVEEELRQSQKMEAIGYLASGVAHDFNNLLTGIMGNTSLLRDKMAGDDPDRSKLDAVVNAAQHAADLTRQLLAYAGKGRFFMERVDLSDLVVQTSKLIHSLIKADVQLRLDLDSHLPLLLADPAQLQQVVMNLVINGAEAIGDAGGGVLVRTGRQTVTEEPLPDLCFNEKMTPGEYVFLEVQDNGSGMDEQTKRRIFDPFFTTKFTGRGLGLASVLGIVRYHIGSIQVHSVPGRGSCFRVLFPLLESLPPRIVEDLNRAELSGSGIVLAIDDEEMIRNFIRSVLEPYGYEVLLARDGAEGIGLIQKRSRDIGLVLLDMAMPGMNGIETLGRIRAIQSDLPVLVCSGSGTWNAEERLVRKEIAGFLPKPYTAVQIARKVKECIRPCSTGD